MLVLELAVAAGQMEAFRAVGEGTGTAIDLDDYDPHYVHLIMWNTQNRELAGAYRIGRTDVLMDSAKGIKAVYNAHFFKFGDKVQKLLRRGLEMGRAFITAPYEMFDINAMFVKENSPFETTFVMTVANGSNAYIASDSAFEFNNGTGSYEVHNRNFPRGTAEALADNFVEMLNELK